MTGKDPAIAAGLLSMLISYTGPLLDAANTT